MRVTLFAVVCVILAPTSVLASPLPPTSSTEAKLSNAFLRLAVTDTNAFLEHIYPHVPAEQRAYIGVIPTSLRTLVQGAEPDGRLVFKAPPRSHALLMTTPVSFRSDAVRAIGVITDNAGKTSYFRSAPFTPPTPSSASRGVEAVYEDRASGKTLIPPRDYDGLLFGSRKVSIAFRDKRRYDSNKDVTLSHVSLRPLGTQPARVRTRVYPERLVDEILAGRPAVDTASTMTGGKAQKEESQFEWSDTPNWSSKERKAIARAEKQKIAVAKGKSPVVKWFNLLRGSSSKRLGGASEE